MNLSTEEKIREFMSLPVEKRQAHCLTILEGVKDQNELFAGLYQAVSDGTATDKDHQDIYASALSVLEDTEAATARASMEKLEEIKNRLSTSREVENEHARREQVDLESILQSI